MRLTEIAGVEWGWGGEWKFGVQSHAESNPGTARAAKYKMYTLRANKYGTLAAGMYGGEAGGPGYIAICNYMSDTLRTTL